MKKDPINRKDWEKIVTVLITALNKGHNICHHPDCNKRKCPEMCDCRHNKGQSKLNTVTASVWFTAETVDRLIPCYDKPKEKPMDKKQFLEKLDRAIIKVATVDAVLSFHSNHWQVERADHYVSLVRYLLEAIKAVVHHGGSEWWSRWNSITFEDRLSDYRQKFKLCGNVRIK